MIFFITGASGFIGRNCCKEIVGQGHKVIALVRGNNQYLNFIGVECYTGDLWDYDNYQNILKIMIKIKYYQ